MIGDRAYGSDPLDAELGYLGVEMIAPHRRRRYKRCWNIRHLFAWLGNFRRLVVRYEYRMENFLGFVRLGCVVILPGRLLRCS